MVRSICTLVLLATTLCAKAQVTSYENPDSLRAENPLECVSATEVAASSSAADVAAGAEDCTENGRFDEAAALLLVSSAFVDFDTRRVADESAHSARHALFASTFSNQSERDMQSLFGALDSFDPNSPEHQRICEHLRDVGPPIYFPKYMIAHGLQAATDPEAPPLIEPFDSARAWEDSLTGFIGCRPDDSD